MKNLVDSYFSWLKENTLLSETHDYLEITTPFLDRHNDCIQIYVKKISDNKFLLTDDGYILDDLEDCGFSFNTPKRKDMLKTLLNIYHIQESNNCLSMTTNISDFPHKKHFFIQGLLAINDLYCLNRNTVSSLFTEDVAKFFDDNNILYTYNVKLTGKSGYDHNIEYILPSVHKKNIPERYIKAINNPNKKNNESVLFTWTDLQNSRKDPNSMFVILNNVDNEVSDETISAYNTYGINTLFWNDKKSIIEELGA